MSMPETRALRSPDPIRVLVADDHPILRGGIAAMIADQPDMVLVGEAGDGEEAIERVAALKPDVTLMDLQMPKIGGLDAIRAICGRAPATRIIVLTTYPRQAHIAQALDAGARGYLVKTSLRSDMLDAIRSVHRGAKYLPTGMLELARDDYEELSERETRVLRLVARGKTNKEIGADLSLSAETIKVVLKALFLKLRVADRTQAVVKAARRGFLDVDA